MSYEDIKNIPNNIHYTVCQRMKKKKKIYIYIELVKLSENKGETQK